MNCFNNLNFLDSDRFLSIFGFSRFPEELSSENVKFEIAGSWVFILDASSRIGAINLSVRGSLSLNFKGTLVEEGFLKLSSKLRPGLSFNLPTVFLMFSVGNSLFS